MTSFCAPARRSVRMCFLEPELLEIANEYNKVTGSNIIDINKPLFPQLEQQFGDLCGPSCWVASPLMKGLRQTIKKYVFKPLIHADRFKWLSTFDINLIMNQYMDFDPTFKFLGTFPSDIVQLYGAEKLKQDIEKCRNYKKIAIVFNLDTSKKIGSHWVCVYINNSTAASSTPTCEYFDSLGQPPSFLINKYLLLWAESSFNLDFIVTSVPFQKQGSECGVYVIYYILNRILGYSIDEILNDSINDSNINYYRDIIFSSTK
jgi:hypothetical protein